MTMTWSFSGYKNCLANIFATGPGTIRARWLQVTGSMGADQTSENSWLHDMTWCTEVKELSVKGMMKFHEIATFVIAFSSMKPFGLGLANETQTCRMFDPKDRWCPKPLEPDMCFRFVSTCYMYTRSISRGLKVSWTCACIIPVWLGDRNWCVEAIWTWFNASIFEDVF